MKGGEEKKLAAKQLHASHPILVSRSMLFKFGGYFWF